MRILSFIALCIAIGVASEAHAVPLYKATRLDFSATAINNRGQIVGENSGGTVLWRKNSEVRLGASGALDINDRGTVLGSDWLWDRNGLTQGAFTGAVAINDRGQVAGNLPRDGAFTWDRDRGTLQVRISDEERFFNVNGIADDGTVLLSWDLWNGSYGLWKGESENAPLPLVLSDCCINSHAVMGTHGSVAGVSLTGPFAPDLPPGVENCGFNGCYVVAIWNSELEPTYVGLQSLADVLFPESQAIRLGVTGMNDDLLIVGSYQSFEHLEYRAYVGSADFGLLDLNDLLTKQAMALLAGSTLKTTQGINDRGWIITKASDGQSYLLQPVPEPGTSMLMMIAGAMLLHQKTAR